MDRYFKSVPVSEFHLGMQMLCINTDGELCFGRIEKSDRYKKFIVSSFQSYFIEYVVEEIFPKEVTA